MIQRKPGDGLLIYRDTIGGGSSLRDEEKLFSSWKSNRHLSYCEETRHLFCAAQLRGRG